MPLRHAVPALDARLRRRWRRWLGIPLLGTYFVYFTLLFVYAAAFPQQTFYLFGMVPIRVRVLALVLAGRAAVRRLRRRRRRTWPPSAAPPLAYAYYYVMQRVRVTFVVMTAARAG